MPFKFKGLSVPGVVLVEQTSFADDRGFFVETFKQSEYKIAGIDFVRVQENHSQSRKGVLRGLHYQSEPFAQAKLVWVVRGSVFDVAVDIRKGSPSYGKWAAAELTAQNKSLLFVPKGFAHGFVALEDNSDVVYLVDAEYSKEHEIGLIWNDGQIGIRWPVMQPLLSERDAKWPELAVNSA